MYVRRELPPPDPDSHREYWRLHGIAFIVAVIFGYSIAFVAVMFILKLIGV